MIIRTISAEAYAILDKKNKNLTDSISSGTKPYTLRGKSKVAIKKIITRKLGNDACDFISSHLQEFRLFDVLLCDTRDKNRPNSLQRLISGFREMQTQLCSFGILFLYSDKHPVHQ